MSSGKPRRPSRPTRGARISLRTRARSPTGPIPGSAAIAPRPNIRTEAQGSPAVPPPPNLSLSALGGGEGRGEVGGSRSGLGFAAPPTSPSPSLARRVPSLSPQKWAEREICRVQVRFAWLAALVFILLSAVLPARADEFATLI